MKIEQICNILVKLSTLSKLYANLDMPTLICQYASKQYLSVTTAPCKCQLSKLFFFGNAPQFQQALLLPKTAKAMTTAPSSTADNFAMSTGKE